MTPNTSSSYEPQFTNYDSESFTIWEQLAKKVEKIRSSETDYSRIKIMIQVIEILQTARNKSNLYNPSNLVLKAEQLAKDYNLLDECIMLDYKWRKTKKTIKSEIRKARYKANEIIDKRLLERAPVLKKMEEYAKIDREERAANEEAAKKERENAVAEAKEKRRIAEKPKAKTKESKVIPISAWIKTTHEEIREEDIPQKQVM